MYHVGVFGATGVVGKEMVKVLHDRAFPVSRLHLFASERSVGKDLETPYGRLPVENADDADYSKLDFAFWAIGGDWPKDNRPRVTENCVVIDNSSSFRYDASTPLIIPEINKNQIQGKFIANPNCTTAIAALPLFAIHQECGLEKVIISTYQAASGAGNDAMDELISETRNYLDNKHVGNKKFAYPLPFNIIPQIDAFQENGYTKEEMKVVWETRKIFNEPELDISCTCVRIPVLRAHSEAITVKTSCKITPDEVRALFSKIPGITLADNPAEKVYPMPKEATGKYDVLVGRVRNNLIWGEYGLDFFVSGDQLLKGAALNAVQIAEVYHERNQ